jgi:predicted DNA-binding antitoxin AbrB/MazE fold protein
MAKQVWAVYEDQVLRLLEPLDLPDGQRVRIQVIESESADQPHALCEEKEAYLAVAAVTQQPDQGQVDGDERDVLVHILTKAGLLVPRPSEPVPPPPLSEAELETLANKLGRVPGKTASEMVIEDRGERT